MARKKGSTTPTPGTTLTTSTPTAQAGTPIVIPAPPHDLAKLIRTTDWPGVRIIHRIHQDVYQAGKATLTEHAPSVDIANDTPTYADLITLAGASVWK